MHKRYVFLSLYSLDCQSSPTARLCFYMHSNNEVQGLFFTAMQSVATS